MFPFLPDSKQAQAKNDNKQNMSNVKSFNVNGTNASINIVTELDDGLMSAQDYITLVDVSSGVNLNTSTAGDKIYPNEVINVISSPEYIDAKTDYTDKLLESTDYNGNKIFYTDVTIEGELKSDTINVLNDDIAELNVNLNEIINDTSAVLNIQSYETFDSSEWLSVTTDSSGKILEGIKSDGTKFVSVLTGPTISSLNSSISTSNDYISDLYLNINSIKKQLDYFGIGIDTSLGVLKIGTNMYKLISYEGTAVFDEYVDGVAFVKSMSTIDSSEFQKIIIDSENKILYGVYIDGTELDNDLYGVTVTNPSTGKSVTINSVLTALK